MLCAPTVFQKNHPDDQEDPTLFPIAADRAMVRHKTSLLLLGAVVPLVLAKDEANASNAVQDVAPQVRIASEEGNLSRRRSHTTLFGMRTRIRAV